ncbi:MAG TPA: hypothetical protein VMC09_08680 [Anaerolineales bacterium]|nr:hypothetical protein [Anaerolineales bacterium]
MNKSLKSFLFWTPRVLSILFILFVGLFSLDVFETKAGFWATLLGFLIHNIPTFILIAALILAWRWEWVGAALFIGFGIWYIAASWGRFDWTAPLLLGGIPILVGLFYLVSWVWRKRIREK